MSFRARENTAASCSNDETESRKPWKREYLLEPNWPLSSVAKHFFVIDRVDRTGGQNMKVRDAVYTMFGIQIPFTLRPTVAD